MGNKQPKKFSAQQVQLTEEQGTTTTHNEPQPTLPQEIFELIFLNIQDKNDIFSLLITCKEWKYVLERSTVVWHSWLRRLASIEEDGDLVWMRSSVKSIFRKGFVARAATDSSTLSHLPVTLKCTVENLSYKPLYLFCGIGLRLETEHSFRGGEAITVISGVGKDLGKKRLGIKDEWPSMWTTMLSSQQAITLETIIQLVNVTVEYYDDDNNLRETKTLLVLQYGYHFWPVIDTKIVLSYQCKASFMAPPCANEYRAYTISEIKASYWQSQGWASQLNLEHQTNTITFDIDPTNVLEFPRRIRERYKPNQG